MQSISSQSDLSPLFTQKAHTNHTNRLQALQVRNRLADGNVYISKTFQHPATPLHTLQSTVSTSYSVCTQSSLNLHRVSTQSPLSLYSSTQLLQLLNHDDCDPSSELEHFENFLILGYMQFKCNSALQAPFTRHSPATQLIHEVQRRLS